MYYIKPYAASSLACPEAHMRACTGKSFEWLDTSIRGFWKDKYQTFDGEEHCGLSHESRKPSALWRLCNCLAPPDLSRTLPVRMRILLGLKWAAGIISKECHRDITRKGLWLLNLHPPHHLPSISHLKPGGQLQKEENKMDTNNQTLWLLLMPRISVPFEGNIIENSQMAKAKSPHDHCKTVFLIYPASSLVLFLLKEPF